ncbi:MAG: hypothetical protein KAT34_09290, partial [Candidatus Aminicenantes bacterium]|nr:hypothetical protein [Candidatus Aminicenantes bacterium]
KTFPVFLKEVKERALNAFDNQNYQFEELVETLQAGRDTGRNPLFDTVFTYRAEQWSQVEENDKDKPDYSYEDTQSRFDLILSGIERGDLIIFIFIYAAGLFKRETIERFAAYFREIVAAVTKNDTIGLSDITISHDLGEVKSDVYQGKESDFDF